MKEAVWILRNAAVRAICVLAVAVAGILMSGCGAPLRGPLSTGEIATHGTLEMAAQRETVFGACILALRMEGYAIDVAEPVTGLVVTMFKRAPKSPSPVWRSRGYVVRVTQLAAGNVQVTATPTAGEALPLAPEPIWDLEHERANWTRFFEDVRMLVARQEGAD